MINLVNIEQLNNLRIYITLKSMWDITIVNNILCQNSGTNKFQRIEIKPSQ